jgi:hypothetical protein
MSGVDVGGDESVMWLVEVDHVRKKDGGPKNEPNGGKGWRQQGVDETDEGNFTITIKIPRDSGDFVRSLRDAASEAEKFAGSPGHPISITLPIEGGNHKQIQIEWDSKASAVST